MFTRQRLLRILAPELGLSTPAIRSRQRVDEIVEHVIVACPELIAEAARDAADRILAHRGPMRRRWQLAGQLVQMADLEQRHAQAA